MRLNVRTLRHVGNCQLSDLFAEFVGFGQDRSIVNNRKINKYQLITLDNRKIANGTFRRF